jgi:hypothetical protein
MFLLLGAGPVVRASASVGVSGAAGLDDPVQQIVLYPIARPILTRSTGPVENTPRVRVPGYNARAARAPDKAESPRELSPTQI